MAAGKLRRQESAASHCKQTPGYCHGHWQRLRRVRGGKLFEIPADAAAPVSRARVCSFTFKPSRLLKDQIYKKVRALALISADDHGY
jgi:hypothetical protein